MKYRNAFAAAALLAAPTAFAGSLTGNVGGVSDYLFRGIDQTNNGAAIQGGADYAFDFGLYTGIWASNAPAAGGNEADLYVGYGLGVGEFSLDAGVVYYLYSEDTEIGSARNTDYAEIYFGGGVGPLSVKVFYTPEFGADLGGARSGDPEKNELLYFTASADLAINETVSLVPQVGLSAGDGVKDAFGDEYIDYSLTAVKRLEDGFSVSLAIVGTNLEPNPSNNDNPKFVVGFRKAFEI